MADSTFYEVLGVSSDATAAEIKAAHRRLTKQVHPDVVGSSELFRQVQEAYETLSDPDRRNEYDHHRLVGAPDSYPPDDSGWVEVDDEPPSPCPNKSRSAADSSTTRTTYTTRTSYTTTTRTTTHTSGPDFPPPPPGQHQPPPGQGSPPPPPGYSSPPQSTPGQLQVLLGRNPSATVTGFGLLIMILAVLAGSPGFGLLGFVAMLLGIVGLIGSSQSKRAKDRSRTDGSLPAFVRRVGSDLAAGAPAIQHALSASKPGGRSKKSGRT